jgi:hypothetical protein
MVDATAASSSFVRWVLLLLLSQFPARLGGEICHDWTDKAFICIQVSGRHSFPARSIEVAMLTVNPAVRMRSMAF